MVAVVRVYLRSVLLRTSVSFASAASPADVFSYSLLGALPGSPPVSDNSPVRMEVWSCNDVVGISVQLAARVFSAVIGYVKWRGVVNGTSRKNITEETVEGGRSCDSKEHRTARRKKEKPREITGYFQLQTNRGVELTLRVSNQYFRGVRDGAERKNWKRKGAQKRRNFVNGPRKRLLSGKWC